MNYFIRMFFHPPSVLSDGKNIKVNKQVVKKIRASVLILIFNTERGGLMGEGRGEKEELFRR